MDAVGSVNQPASGQALHCAADIGADEIGSQNAVVGPADVVTRREGLLDDLQLVVHSRLQLEHHAAVTDGLRLKDDVPLTATVDIGDRVTGVQCFDGHQIRISV